MNNKINVNELLKKLSEKYPEDMKSIDAMDEDRFHDIERRALVEYSTSSRGRMPVGLKAAAIVAGIVILFTGMLFLLETPTVRAYKSHIEEFVFNVVSDEEPVEVPNNWVVELDDFTKAQNAIPFHIPYPQWVPDKYEFNFIDYRELEDGHYAIRYLFNHSKIIGRVLDVRIETSHTEETIDKDGAEHVVIDNKDVYVRVDDSKDGCYSCGQYINGEELFISVGISGDEDTLIKIIENME